MVKILDNRKADHKTDFLNDCDDIPAKMLICADKLKERADENAVIMILPVTAAHRNEQR